MLSVLQVTFPFFALVVCGYLAVRRGILPVASIPGLNAFVLYFALPCMLYRFGARTPIGELLDPGVFLVYTACGIAIVALGAWMARRRGMDWNNSAFCALVTAFPNTGFMGVPLITALLGPAVAGPVILTIAIDMVVTSSLCIALSRRDAGGAAGMRHAVGQTLRGMASNPMPWSIVLGALASAVGFALPGPLDRTVALLGDAASPAALFTIGCVLARAQMGPDTRAPLADYVPLALVKLLLHPALVLGVGWAAIAAGLPLQHTTLVPLVLAAALPGAGNVVLLTERFGADSGLVARIILASTVLSFFSFAAAVVLVH